MSAKDNKIMQSIVSIEIYAYETRKNLICKNEEIKCNNIIKQHEKWLTMMMLQKTYWPQIPNHP